MAFLSVLHMILAVVVILLVLVQDSKGGGMGGAFGGSGSNPLLGPTGTPSLLNKLTRYTIVGFAATSIILTNMSSNKSASALDQVKPADSAPATVPTNPAAPADPAAPAQAPANPAAPAPQSK